MAMAAEATPRAGGASVPSSKMAAPVGAVIGPAPAAPSRPASLSTLPPPPSAPSPVGGARAEGSGLWAPEMAAAAATAVTKGNGGGGSRAASGEAGGARKKGPGPLATAYLVIYNVVMTAG